MKRKSNRPLTDWGRRRARERNLRAREMLAASDDSEGTLMPSSLKHDMKITPTPEKLAAIAARLDPELSPDEAIARAKALLEAAHSVSRAAEDQQEEKRLLAQTEKLERIGLDFVRYEEIPVLEALGVARRIALRLGVPCNYKTENGFANALRKAQLTLVRTIYDKTIQEESKSEQEWTTKVKEWIESGQPESEQPYGERPTRSIVGREELTSERAIEEFFKRKAEHKKRQDRARKAVSRKRYKENVAEFKRQKTERIRRKADPENKKRKRATK
jgi:hypothetical protein